MGIAGAAIQIALLLAFSGIAAAGIARMNWPKYFALLLFLALTLAQSRPVLNLGSFLPRRAFLNKGESLARRPMPELADWRQVWTEFRRKSNWTYAEAIRKIQKHAGEIAKV